MFLKNQIMFSFILLIILFSLVQLQTKSMIIIYPSDNNITDYCSKNTYYFEFECKFSEKLNQIIPFEMEIPLPNRLPFKCVIDGPKSKILCFHSFSNYVWSLNDNSRIELPYSFPEIEGIKWDYDTFLTKIYRYLWRNKGNCGLELEQLNDGSLVNNEIIKDLNNDKKQKSELIVNIEEIIDGRCYSSKYDYSFNMILKFINGEIVEELKNAKNSKTKKKVSFLHNIYVPLLLGEKKKKGATTFKKDYEYKYAACKYNGYITQDNFDNNEGLYFECHLQINKYKSFQGPLQIKPFTDFAYITKTDKDGKTSTDIISIQFDILSSSIVEEDDDNENEDDDDDDDEKKNENATTGETKQIRLEEKERVHSKINLRNLDDKSNAKEPNFLILDSNLHEYICPDIPILTIKNYNEGICFGG